MSEKPTVTLSCGSILFLASLGLAGLKLTGYIDWPWWLILSPFIFEILLFVGLFLILVILAILEKING